MQDRKNEICFNFSAKSSSSARGLVYVLLGAAFVTGALSLLLASGLGSGVLLFILVSLYFLGFALFQEVQYRKMKRSAILVDDNGLYLFCLGRELFFSPDEVYAKLVNAALLLGLGGKRRVYRAVCFANGQLVVDLGSLVADDELARSAVGKPFLLDSEQYAAFVSELEKRGWVRDAELKLEKKVEPRVGKLSAILLGVVAVVLLVLFFVASNRRLSISFLLGSVGAGALAWTLLKKRGK